MYSPNPMKGEARECTVLHTINQPSLFIMENEMQFVTGQLHQKNFVYSESAAKELKAQIDEQNEHEYILKKKSNAAAMVTFVSSAGAFLLVALFCFILLIFKMYNSEVLVAMLAASSILTFIFSYAAIKRFRRPKQELPEPLYDDTLELRYYMLTKEKRIISISYAYSPYNKFSRLYLMLEDKDGEIWQESMSLPWAYKNKLDKPVVNLQAGKLYIPFRSQSK